MPEEDFAGEVRRIKRSLGEYGYEGASWLCQEALRFWGEGLTIWKLKNHLKRHTPCILRWL